MNRIEAVTGDLSDEEKSTYICCTMWIYICERDSTFNTTATDAGGNWYGNVNSEFGSTYQGDGSTSMSSVEALSNYTGIDAVINNRSMDWGLDQSEMKSTVLNCWENERNGHPVYEYFRGLEDNMVFVNNLLPGAVKRGPAGVHRPRNGTAERTDDGHDTRVHRLRRLPGRQGLIKRGAMPPISRYHG